MAVVGAGYIGVELAGILNGLGAETHLFIRRNTFLRNFDAEVIAKLAFERLSKVVNDDRVWISKVVLWENERCSATYYEEV